VAERGRIAGELHDVLAHALSGLAIQLQGARKLANAEGASAGLRAAIERSADLAKEGLADGRQAVGALRGDRLPTIGQLAALVADFRRDIGTDVSVAIEGVPRPLPADADLALYRGAQEGLTNIARYAPGATAAVTVRYAPGCTVLTVQNSASPPHDGAATAPGTAPPRDGAVAAADSPPRERAATAASTLPPHDGSVIAATSLPNARTATAPGTRQHERPATAAGSRSRESAVTTSVSSPPHDGAATAATSPPPHQRTATTASTPPPHDGAVAAADSPPREHAATEASTLPTHHGAVTAADPGPGLLAGAGGGHGLVTMRERAERVGGTARSGPRDGGWLVEVEVPV
jgi:hypothetical protein